MLLDNISDLLDAKYTPEENGQFLVIAQGEPFQLSNELQVERSALRGLTRYSGQTKKLTISFDSSLLNVSVFYDAENDEIKITELPQKLKVQLNKEAN